MLMLFSYENVGPPLTRNNIGCPVCFLFCLVPFSFSCEYTVLRAKQSLVEPRGLCALHVIP